MSRSDRCLGMEIIILKFKTLPTYNEKFKILYLACMLYR